MFLYEHAHCAILTLIAFKLWQIVSPYTSYTHFFILLFFYTRQLSSLPRRFKKFPLSPPSPSNLPVCWWPIISRQPDVITRIPGRSRLRVTFLGRAISTLPTVGTCLLGLSVRSDQISWCFPLPTVYIICLKELIFFPCIYHYEILLLIYFSFSLRRGGEKNSYYVASRLFRCIYGSWMMKRLLTLMTHY